MNDQRDRRKPTQHTRLVALLWGYDNTDASKTADRLLAAGVTVGLDEERLAKAVERACNLHVWATYRTLGSASRVEPKQVASEIAAEYDRLAGGQP